MSDDHSVSQLLDSSSPICSRSYEQLGGLGSTEDSGDNTLQGGANNTSPLFGLGYEPGGDDMSFLSEFNSAQASGTTGHAVAPSSAGQQNVGRFSNHPPPDIRVGEGPGAPVTPSESDTGSNENGEAENVEEQEYTPRWGKTVRDIYEPTHEMSREEMLRLFQNGNLRLRNLDQLLLFLNTIPSKKREFRTIGETMYWLLFNRNSHISLYNLLSQKYGIRLNGKVFNALNSESKFTKKSLVRIFYNECDPVWHDHEVHLEKFLNNCMTGLLDGCLSKIVFNGIPKDVKKKIANFKSQKKTPGASSTSNNSRLACPRTSTKKPSNPKRKRLSDDNDGDGDVSRSQHVPTTPPDPPPDWPEPSTTSRTAPPQQSDPQHESDPQQQSGLAPLPVRPAGEGNPLGLHTEGNNWGDSDNWSPEQQDAEMETIDTENVTRQQPSPLGSHEGAAGQVQQQQGTMQFSSSGGGPSDLPELYDEDLQRALFGYINEINMQQRRHEEAAQKIHATFNEGLRRKVHEVGVYLQDWDRRREKLANDLEVESQKLAAVAVNREAIEQEILNFQAEQTRIKSEQQSRWRVIDTTREELNRSAATLRDSQMNHAANVEALRSDRGALEAERALVAEDSKLLAQQRGALARDREDLDTAMVAFENRRSMEQVAWDFEKERQQNLLDETLREKKEVWTAHQNETRRALNENIDKQRQKFAEEKAAWDTERAEQERALQVRDQETRAALESARATEARARELEATTRAKEAEYKRQEVEVREKLQRTVDLTNKLEERINNKTHVFEAEMAQKTSVLNQQINLNKTIHDQLESREAQVSARERHAMDCQVAMNGYFSRLQCQIFQALKTQAEVLKIPLESQDDVKNLIGNINVPLPTNIVYEDNPLALLMQSSDIDNAAARGRVFTGLGPPAAAGEGDPPAAAGEGGLPAAAGGGPGGGGGGGR